MKLHDAWNDPSSQITSLSKSFEDGIRKSTSDIQTLRSLASAQGNTVKSKQHMLHYEGIVDSLRSRLGADKLLVPYKAALKQHQDQLKSTEGRLRMYGASEGDDKPYASSFGANDSLRRRSNNSNIDSGSSSLNSNGNYSSVSGGKKIHSYGGGNPSHQVDDYSKTSKKPSTPYSNIPSPYESSSSSGGGGGSGSSQRQGLMSRQRTESKLDQASKVEAKVAQVGELFQQLASLVAQQSEQITSIEDNVDDGLETTKEAHTLMLSFYEITKGNRSLILKIFALIIFFIIIFLVKWR